MKVYIDRDEWFPVYFLQNDPAWGEVEVDMEEKDYERLKKAVKVATDNFCAVQNELGDLFAKGKKVKK